MESEVVMQAKRKVYFIHEGGTGMAADFFIEGIQPISSRKVVKWCLVFRKDLLRRLKMNWDVLLRETLMVNGDREPFTKRNCGRNCGLR